MKKVIISQALSMMRVYFSISELAYLLGVRYSTICDYLDGRKQLPLKFAFFVLDYLGCKLVILPS